MKRKGRIVWYVIFAVLIVAVFSAVHLLTGYDVIGATARFLWRALTLAANGLARVFGGFLTLLAKGVGFRRLGRGATAVGSIGLGYVGSLFLSDAVVLKAHGWRRRLRAAVTLAARRWQRLDLAGKLAIVALLIASQLYLHSLLIVFPIAFLVPVVRRLWIQVADSLFGSWYWRTFRHRHRIAVGWLARRPVLRHAIGGARIARIRYLTAWRLWKYDPRYRSTETNRRRISFIEPLRLWWQGKLDGYVGRPLLAGRPEKQAHEIEGSPPLVGENGLLRLPGLPR